MRIAAFTFLLFLTACSNPFATNDVPELEASMTPVFPATWTVEPHTPPHPVQGKVRPEQFMHSLATDADVPASNHVIFDFSIPDVEHSLRLCALQSNEPWLLPDSDDPANCDGRKFFIEVDIDARFSVDQPVQRAMIYCRNVQKECVETVHRAAAEWNAAIPEPQDPAFG